MLNPNISKIQLLQKTDIILANDNATHRTILHIVIFSSIIYKTNEFTKWISR